jgi:hypothetical protein
MSRRNEPRPGSPVIHRHGTEVEPSRHVRSVQNAPAFTAHLHAAAQPKYNPTFDFETVNFFRMKNMTPSSLIGSARQVLKLALTGFATLLVASTIGCNKDSSVPESSPPPAVDPAAAASTIDVDEK